MNHTKVQTLKSTGQQKELFQELKTKGNADLAGHSAQSPQLNPTHFSTTNTFPYQNNNSSTVLTCMETLDAMVDGQKGVSSTSRTKVFPLKFNTLTKQ